MQLLNFLQNETDKPLHKIVIMAAASGVANAALLAIINSVAKNVSSDGTDFQNLLLFAVTLTIFIVSQKYILRESTIVIENAIASIRRRLSDKIRRSDLLSQEAIGRSEIYNRLTQETITVSNSASILVMSVQAAIMLSFVALYIAILSRIAFALILLLLVVAIFYYIQQHKKLKSALLAANTTEMAYFDSLTDILQGIKEIKFSKKKSKGLITFLNGITIKLKKIKISTAVKYLDNNLFAQTFYYFLLGALIFILPRLVKNYTTDMMPIVSTVLFMIGPVGIVVAAIQMFDQVGFAVSNIYHLEAELDKSLEINENEAGYDNRLQNVTSFDKIHLKDFQFYFKDQNDNISFSIGPFNLDFKQGETVFLVGGNGSGKTTFLRALSMLYYNCGGSLSLDDVTINRGNAVDYRELFSTIFSDFHLFSRLYDLEKINRDKVAEMLKTMGIDHKTQFLEDRFSTLDLSTGQRKRLAMVVALLEDKPIYIFDEWAADQDPEFRQYFYEVLLKDLKAQGKTIIAASHDDRYFHYADRVIKLDYGKIAEDSRGHSA
ncbi:MAG: cyclic peptide export ABC transporter, partial [bacterium]|nr:cyclic peptide export ABC transporter [bacterium]